MELKDFAAELVSKNHFIKASFGGFQGSGKTFTATDFIIGCYKDLKLSKPILCLDNEKGSRFLIPIFKKAGITALVKDTNTLADVKQAFKFLESGEIDFLFIDSLTKFYYKYVKDYKTKNKKTFMQLNDWGKLLPSWQEEFSDVFVNTVGNIVFTGRGGFEYDKEEDSVNERGEVEKGNFVKSGMKMKIAGETPYETDLNIWMSLEKTLVKDRPKQTNIASVLKDRSDTINGETFISPKYKDFRPVIKFIQNLPIGEVLRESLDENVTPGSDKEYYEFHAQRKIEIEKIEGLFELNNLGSPRSKEDIRLKAAIIKSIFGTTSKTEIERMKPTELNFRKAELEEVFNEMKNYEDKYEFITNYKSEKIVAA